MNGACSCVCFSEAVAAAVWTSVTADLAAATYLLLYQRLPPMTTLCAAAAAKLAATEGTTAAAAFAAAEETRSMPSRSLRLRLEAENHLQWLNHLKPLW